MEMPSQEEQRIAEEYVMERPLPRPDTDIKKAVLFTAIFIIGSFSAGLLLLSLLSWLGISFSFLKNISIFCSQHTILFFVIVYFLASLISAKKAAIGAIRLYQHYAPEEIRRRCLFKPTCSEYAILAIQKYGLIIGLIKAYKRLFKRCIGNIYQIDYP